MKKKKYLTLVLMLAFTAMLNAQGPPPPPPPGLPISEGVLFLFVSGIIYGVNKLRE